MVLPSMNKSVEAISNNHLQQPNKFPLINGLADVRLLCRKLLIV